MQRLSQDLYQQAHTIQEKSENKITLNMPECASQPFFYEPHEICGVHLRAFPMVGMYVAEIDMKICKDTLVPASWEHTRARAEQIPRYVSMIQTS